MKTVYAVVFRDGAYEAYRKRGDRWESWQMWWNGHYYVKCWQFTHIYSQGPGEVQHMGYLEMMETLVLHKQSGFGLTAYLFALTT